MMKIKVSLHRRCLFCKLIIRNNKNYIYCTKYKKHKQKQK